METFFKFVHKVEFTENPRHLPVFFWMVISLSVIANAQSNERTSEYELSLTCIFGENIEQRRHGFRILDDQSAVAVKCSWRQEKLYCALGDGFTYDWTRSDKVAVRKNVYSHEASFCSCFLIDYDQNENERPCSTEVRPVLELIERPPQNTEPSVDKPSQNSHSEAASSNSQRSESSDRVLIPVAAALGLLLIVAIIVASYFFVRFRGPAEGRDQEKNLPEKLPLHQAA